MLEIQGKYGKDCKIFIDDVEQSALATIYGILDDEISAGVPVRIMPDTHNGVDVVIGFTMPLSDRINPNHIGVDIGCGVLTARLDIVSDMSLSEIDNKIREAVPLGFARHQTNHIIPAQEHQKLAKKLGCDIGAVMCQIGTLGGGNHFIELGVSSADEALYLTIHSGSRNFGLQTCNYHVRKAKEKGEKYLFGYDMEEYLEDMRIAQKFAADNRIAILISILSACGFKSTMSFDTIHNYIDPRDNIIRKGAVSAYKDELLAIPFNMRDGIVIARGKGNKDWNYSAPHGAGRILSRSAAKETLSIEDFTKEMEGIYSTSVNQSTLDESPMAYKDANVIKEAIEPTADILFTVKPILNIKA